MARAQAELRVQSLPRFAMRREEAAASLGISPSKFDIWVNDGRMPEGHKVDGIRLWDVGEVRERWLEMRDGVIIRNPLDEMVL